MGSEADRGLDFNSAVNAVVEISRASERARKGLERKIISLVKDEQPTSPDVVRNFERVLDEWTKRRFRMLEARAELRDAAMEMKRAIEDYDRAYGRRDRLEEVAPPPIDRLLREVLKWAKQPFLVYEVRGKGRPPANSALVRFVLRLLVFVRNAGGDLTYDRIIQRKARSFGRSIF